MSKQPFLSRLCFHIATGFGSGLIPKAPGTFGSLLGIPLAVLLFPQGSFFFIATLAVMSVLSISIITQAEQILGEHDSPKIVLDEIIGQAIPFIFVEPTISTVISGFLLFRLFDIVKKGPVGYVDKNVSGAVGVLLDDIVAGVLAACVLFTMFALFRLP